MRQRIIRWYAVRVKDPTEKNIQHLLERAGIEHYIPPTSGESAVPGLVFLHTDYNRAVSLREEMDQLISCLQDSLDEDFLVISDPEMERFHFLQRFVGKFYYLPDPENLRGGEKVRVVGGEYAGIEGEIYRLKGHKRVVVRLGHTLSVAMSEYIAKEHLEKL